MSVKKVRDFLDLIEKSKTLKKIGSLKKHPAFPELEHKTNFLPHTVSVAQRLWHIDKNIFHIPACKMCQTSVRWRKERKSYNTYCSSKCAHSDPQLKQKTEQTNIERYGVKKPLQNKTIMEKTIQNNIQRSGVDNPSKIEEVKRKKTKTSIKNYGTEHPSQSKIIRQKTERTNLEKYGYKNPFSNKDIIQKIQKVIKEKYGNKREGILEKTKSTNKQRYGVEWNITKLKKYGSGNISCQHIPQISIQLLNDKEWLLEEHHLQKRTLENISKEIGVSDVTLGRYLKKYKIDVLRFPHSNGEREIYKFLEKMDIKDIKTNCRHIIYPYELDIFLPEYNLAIEYCGLYWHSEKILKNKNYHFEKYKKCREKGIRLITIFSDEWEYKEDIVKSTIQHIIGRKNSKRIYARDMSIRMVNNTEKKKFLEKYHIQGNGRSSIDIGLYYHDEVICIMSLIKQKNEWIINRYASKYIVPGGFTKLLTYFKRNYKWSKIITFSDLRWSEGNLYELAGFSYGGLVRPDYSYSINGQKRIHKFNFRKKYLPKILEKYDQNLSEKKNCDMNGILRIWDCGKYRWVLQ